VHAHKMRVSEVHTHEIHAYEVHALGDALPVRMRQSPGLTSQPLIYSSEIWSHLDPHNASFWASALVPTHYVCRFPVRMTGPSARPSGFLAATPLHEAACDAVTTRFLVFTLQSRLIILQQSHKLLQLCLCVPRPGGGSGLATAS
jgi:hypothetical protein